MVSARGFRKTSLANSLVLVRIPDFPTPSPALIVIVIAAA